MGKFILNKMVDKNKDVFANIDEKMELSAADNDALMHFETV